MKVEESALLDVLGLQDTMLAIPAYQRKYAWQERQCQELWLDVMRAARRGVSHFAGTVLYKREHEDNSGSPENTLLVVDGQQRLTTVELMLIALRDYLAERNEEIGSLSAETIDKQYLKLSNGAPKLRLSRMDEKSMKMAIEGSQSKQDGIDEQTTTAASKESQAIKAAPRNVLRNLAYFKSLMEEDGFDASMFSSGLKNLEVILVELEDRDDEQAVFESLNSSGKQLHIGDMVRNYLLAAETHERQSQLYIDYWTVIEGVFEPDPGSLKMDTMIKAWLSVRFPKVRARKPEDVYSAFKRFYDDEYCGDLEPALAELRSFAMVWAENYRYHAVKKFKSMPWAQIGAQTLVSGRELKKADNEEYAQRVRDELRAMGRSL